MSFDIGALLKNWFINLLVLRVDNNISKATSI